jgi:hypothetical protein
VCVVWVCGFWWGCVCVCVCGWVCVCVCVRSTAFAGLHIDNQPGRSSCDKYCSTSQYNLQFITTLGTVQCVTFPAICTVGFREICGKITCVGGAGGWLPSVERVNVAARRKQWTVYRAVFSGINWGTKRKQWKEACYNTLWRIRLVRHVVHMPNGKCIQNPNCIKTS